MGWAGQGDLILFGSSNRPKLVFRQRSKIQTCKMAATPEEPFQFVFLSAQHAGNRTQRALLLNLMGCRVDCLSVWTSVLHKNDCYSLVLQFCGELQLPCQKGTVLSGYEMNSRIATRFCMKPSKFFTWETQW